MRAFVRNHVSRTILPMICLFLFLFAGRWMAVCAGELDEVADAKLDNVQFFSYNQFLSGVLDLGEYELQRRHVPEGFLPELESVHPRLHLALSGGGARGLAHIGVLKALETEEIPIDHIVGTSMGAIVGGLYASGYSAGELNKIVEQINWGGLFSDAPSRRNLFLQQKETANRHLITLRFRQGRPYIPDALVQGETLYLEILRQIRKAPCPPIGDDFTTCRTEFTAVTTDIIKGSGVFLDRGDLALTLRASMSVPLVFRPVRRNDYLLVDGGAVENIPTRAARSLGGDIVVGVDCASPATPDLSPDKPWEIANQVTTLMTVANDSASRNEADLLLTPDLSFIGNSDFENIQRIIDAGEAAAWAHMDALRALVGTGKRQALLVADVERVITFTDQPRRVRLSVESFGLRRGRYSTEQVNKSLMQILRELRLRGYGGAKVRAELDDNGTLFVHVTLGVIESIRIEGIVEDHFAEARREITLSPGLPLETGNLLRSITQLHATGRYTNVYSELEMRDDGKITVVFHLDEAPLPLVRLGIGFDTDYRSRYSTEVALPNIFGILTDNILFWGRYGERDQRYGFDINANRIASTYLGWQLTGEYRNRDQRMYNGKGEVAYDTDVYSSEIRLKTLFNAGKWGRISLGTAMQRLSDNFSGKMHMSSNYSFGVRGTIDTQDKRPFPTKGTFVDLVYESYVPFSGSELNFNIAQVKIENVIPLTRRLATSAMFHGGVSELPTPLTHRFAIGGMTDFMALPPHRFIALSRVGGRVEFRYDMISRILADAYVLFRYDIAAFSDQKDWRPKRDELIQSYAAGVAFDTMVGPLEFWGAFMPESSTAPSERRIMVNLGYRF